MQCMLKNVFRDFQNSDKMRVSVFSVFAHSFVTLVCSGPPVFNLYRVFSMVCLSHCHSVIGLFVYHSRSVLVILSFFQSVFTSHTGSGLVLWSLMYRPYLRLVPYSLAVSLVIVSKIGCVSP